MLSLSSMASLAQSARYERKFLINGQYQHQLQLWLRQHPAGFSEHFPERQVNSLYFDQPDWEFYHNNVVGSPQRQKVRVRWYGAEHPPTQPQLEQKRKNGFLGSKHVYPLSQFQISATGQVSWQPHEQAPLLLTTHPVLMNQYHRQYWQTRDKTVRATIDSQLQFWPVDRASHQIQWNQPRAVSVTILELKYAPATDDSIHRIVRHLPLRMTKSSKYVIGVDQLYSTITRPLS